MRPITDPTILQIITPPEAGKAGFIRGGFAQAGSARTASSPSGFAQSDAAGSRFVGGRTAKDQAVASRAHRAGHLASSLALLAVSASPHGGLRLMAEHIELLGARQWLGLMAGNAIAAPLARRLAGAFNRRPPPVGESRHATAA